MPAEPMSRARLAVVTAGVMVSLFLAALDQTIVGTAMPRIVAELRGLDYYAWVLTAYMVASTTMVPIAGKLGDLFGRKPLLIAGMAGFVVASALCGQARDMPQLVGFRGLQGVFGGVLFATVFASIADLYEPRARARIQGVFGGVFALASIVGPTVGGYLTDSVGWRWVFYVNIPIGLAAIAFVAFTMPAVRARATWRSIDFPGAFALAAGLVPLLVAFSLTTDHAWTSPQVLGLFAFSAIVLGAFFLIERRADHPIVPFALFRNRTFAVAVSAGFLVAVGMFGTIVYVPLLYQGVLGVSATGSGALLTPMMLGLVASSVLAGQLMVRIRRYRYVGTAGIALTTIGLLLLAQVRPGTSPVQVVADLVIVGVGVGATFPLYINSVQSAISRELTGVVTSQVQFWRNVGATIGVAVLGSVLARQLPVEVARAVTTVLPPGAQEGLAEGAGNAQALFDPDLLARLPPAAVEAIRGALASSLHDLFTYAAYVVAVAGVVSLFLDDVPIRDRPSGERREPEPATAFGK
ncbi:MAG TPA: MDR family MFS transporter [Candidatus Limnocylindrales bacterium]|nr:MDR family MFS transporter [Candidatus Limnocylindrales bacterium]